MPETPSQPEDKKPNQKQLTNRKILAFSVEFGFMIALPLVIFAFTGKWLAEKYDNQIYFYGAIILALLTSFGWFWKRITDIYNDFLN